MPESWLDRYSEPTPGAFGRMWEWAGRGLADPLAKRASESITTPTIGRSDREGWWRGFAGGAMEGASTALTSPLSIVSNLLSGGAATAARFGLPAVARAASLANASIGAPSLVHGAGEVFEGANEGDWSRVGQGALETGVGALGTLSPFLHTGPPVSTPAMRPRGNPPPVKLGLPSGPASGVYEPSGDMARKAAYLARSGRTMPPQGSIPSPGRNINAPVREDAVRQPNPLAAMFGEPEPLGLPDVPIPLQDWLARRVDSPVDAGVNPRRMNEPPPQQSAIELLDQHFFPNGRRTVPEQQVVPGAPWSNTGLLEESSPAAMPWEPGAQQRPLPGSLEPGTPAGGGPDLDLESLGQLDRDSNAQFLERFMASLESQSRPPAAAAADNPLMEILQPGRHRDVPELPGPAPEPIAPTSMNVAPSQEFSDPDLISRLFAYGPSKTYESILGGGEPYFSPEVLAELGTQPGGFARPEDDILEAAKRIAKGYVAPDERELPWNQRLAMRSNEQRYQHAINEPDPPARADSMAALQAAGGERAIDADALEAQLFNRERTWQDFTRDEKLAVESSRRTQSETSRTARQAEEARAQSELEASLPARFADAPPEEQRELRRMLAEMREFPFSGRNFYRPPTGGMEVTGNTPGAPIFHDIMGGRSGSRRAAIRALEAFIEQGKPATAITRRAAHVARRASEGDSGLRRRMLPPDAGDLPDPDVAFPFGDNDPAGEGGFVSVDPAEWKNAAARGSKALEALDYFSMLSGPFTHLKNIGGNLGAVGLEAARRGIRGDFGTAGRIMKETFNPEWVRDLRTGFQHPEGSNWTPGPSDYAARKGVMSWPTRAAGAPDFATRQALLRAGLTEAEARQVTYTGEPRSKSGAAFVNGVREAGAVGRFVSPFPRIATNLLETGLEHTPVVGSLAQAISKGRLQSGWDKQALGALAMLGGATMGPASELLGDTWGPVAQSVLGPVNLPYTAGATLASALESGDSMPDAGRQAWDTFTSATPIPQFVGGPADWFARKVPNFFSQVGLSDPSATRSVANDWWPVGRALGKIPWIGDRLMLGANPAQQDTWLSRYADR